MTDDFNNYASGTAVDSGAVNNGGTLTTKDGLKCVEFTTKTNYITLPSITSNTNGYTIAFSFYISNIPSDYDSLLQLYSDISNYNRNGISLSIIGNKIRPWSGSGLKNGVYVHSEFLSFLFDNIIINNWNQIVWTINKLNVGSFYLNGNLLNVTQSGSSTNAPLCYCPTVNLPYCNIGYYTNSTSYSYARTGFIGSIRDLIYYDNVLTQSDVTYIYNLM